MLRTDEFLMHIPLHLSALERQPRNLRKWVESWFSQGGEGTLLEARDWFDKGHTKPRCCWPPAPTIADAALEQLAKAVHKRPHHIHVMLVPCLMTAHWRKLMLKICDLYFTVPVGADVWSLTQYEPLNVGLCLPLSRCLPWKL
jgi:hypothetical protein